VNHKTKNVRTTESDRIENLRIMLQGLEAAHAQGNDLEDVIKELRRTIARREKELAA
jgi:4-diphosphocytidyl-2C-methyl-D-erythritol kinase